MGIVLIIVGVGFFVLAAQGMRTWYRVRAAGNPTPPTNWMMLVGPFVGIIAVLAGIFVMMS
jgi:hypothetical protein